MFFFWLGSPTPGDLALAPTKTTVGAVMRGFLLRVLPSNTEVIEGQINRVPEPKAKNFVVFTERRRNRLATNEDRYLDRVFQGRIDGKVLTVTAFSRGNALKKGDFIFGIAVVPGTRIAAFGDGDGSIGTYQVNVAQTVPPGMLAAGQLGAKQSTELIIQVDLHGPLSADNAQIVSTLFRDDFGVQMFADAGDFAAPLYADDPLQLPYDDGEQQVEERWIVDLHLQINPVVLAGLQFADQLKAKLIEIS